MRRKIQTDGNRFPKVQEVPLETRRLVIFQPEDFLCGIEPDVRDAIVWLKPPPNTPGDDIEGFKDWAKKNGAVRVLILRPDSVDTPLPQDARDQEVAPHASIREIVTELIEALPDATRDPARGIIEKAMSEVGL